MNIKQQKSKKPLAISLVIVLISAVAYTGYAYSSSSWPFNTPNTSIESETATTQVSNPDISKSKDKDPSDPDANIPIQYTPSKDKNDAKNNNELTGIVNFTGISDSNLIIRTTINQIVNTGTCTLLLKSNNTGKTVTKNAKITTSPSSSSCEGFSIPTSELSDGEWSITINLESDDKNGRLSSSIKI